MENLEINALLDTLLSNKWSFFPDGKVENANWSDSVEINGILKCEIDNQFQREVFRYKLCRHFLNFNVIGDCRFNARSAQDVTF